MADTRINALSTATVSISDDFLPIDGTTAGTKKLSAYNPSFGGNATVGGTLTVGSNLTVSGNIAYIGASGSGTGGGLRVVDDGGTTRWLAGLSGVAGARDYIIYDIVSTRQPISISSSTGVITIAGTTASTSSSSGALVVGNGTSGGLGVGGMISVNGGLGVGRYSAVSGGSARVDINGTGVSGFPQLMVSDTTGRQWEFRGVDASASFILDYWNGAGSRTNNLLTISAGGNLGVLGSVTVNSTTASTSTSSGALVVSGGVGVAKRIYSGEGLDTAGDNATHISFVRNGTISIGPTSAATPKLQVGGGLLLANTSQSVPAWGDVGAQLSVAGAVLTDTSSSGTVSRVVVNSIASSALAASSTTTYTQAATLFISNAPTANTNVTITNAYAIYTAGGRINFQGLPTSSAGLQAGTLWNDGGTLKIA